MLLCEYLLVFGHRYQCVTPYSKAPKRSFQKIVTCAIKDEEHYAIETCKILGRPKLLSKSVLQDDRLNVFVRVCKCARDKIFWPQSYKAGDRFIEMAVPI